MGQRHQIFIQTVNPAKVFQDDQITPEQKELLGDEELTILPFHNQWLYGRSALKNALNVLISASQFSPEDKMKLNGFGGPYNTPFSFKGLDSRQRFASNFEAYIKTMEFIMNYNQAACEPSISAGLFGGFYLGEHDRKICEYFDRGDNNDGITIIDAVNCRYCFMNIYGQDITDNSSSKLPSMTPVDAAAYVRAYYPEDKLSEYDRKRCEEKGESVDEVLRSYAEGNALLIKQFENFEVLTVPQLIDMFPKMEEKLTAAITTS